MGCLIATLFVIGFLVVEHSLRDVLYESIAKKWSNEYVRRQRLVLKLFAASALVYLWAISLVQEIRVYSTELFLLMAVVFAALGVWVLLGSRHKD
jgi:hypothetical protein